MNSTAIPFEFIPLISDTLLGYYRNGVLKKKKKRKYR